MPNLKISQLNDADALTGTELVECVQDGANVKTTAQAIASLAILSDITGISGADRVTNIISLTQAEYNAITPDSATLYVIVG
jgi:hypothetical protein